MKILITEISDKRISGVLQDGLPEAGREYFLEDARNGTLAQNRLFHLLLRMYFDQGGYSWPAKSLNALRKYVLRDLGAGFEWFAYVTEQGTIGKAEKFQDLPAGIHRDQVLGSPKSWSLYTLTERRRTISALITQMEHDGVTGKVFDAIVSEARA
jgi:hypothetical protein